MPRFLYKAKNNKGEIITGTVRSATQTEAEGILVKHNLVPIDIVLPRSKKPGFLGRISVHDKAVYSRQLATMLSAGLSLPKAISVVAKQAKNNYQRDVFLDIYKDLQEGFSFSSSLAKHPEAFDRLYVSVVNSGENTGKLDVVLNELADQLENDSDFISKVKSSLYYPVFVLVALLIIGVFMMAYVVPKLKDLFAQAQAELPLITRYLIAVSGFLEKFWWLAAALFVVAILLVRYWVQTDIGSRTWSQMQIRLPGLKSIYEGIFMFRFTRTMAMLIGAGVPLLDALRISAAVITNDVYEESILVTIRQVEKGVPLSVQLLKDPAFPALVGQMTAVGEETGELDKVLTKVADYYQQRTNDLTRGISSLIEPMVLICVGLGVAFIVFAIYIPIYQISQLATE